MIAQLSSPELLGGVALVITAVGGLIIGLLNHKQTKAVEEDKADASSVRTLGELVDRYRVETVRTDEKLAACERDKDKLQEQINQIWRTVGRNESTETPT